jgi:hypothetical protein
MGSNTDRLAAELERLPAAEWERLAALHPTYPESNTIPLLDEADNEPSVKVGADATADHLPACDGPSR